MGDRVAVLKQGLLQQVDVPRVLWAPGEPVHGRVHRLAGDEPRRRRVVERDDHLTVSFGSTTLELDDRVLDRRPALRGCDGRRVVVGIRPEDLDDASLVPDAPGRRRMAATVDLIEALGAEVLAHFTVDAPPVVTDDTKGSCRTSRPPSSLEARVEEGTSSFVARLDRAPGHGAANASRWPSTSSACTSSTSRTGAASTTDERRARYGSSERRARSEHRRCPRGSWRRPSSAFAILGGVTVWALATRTVRPESAGPAYYVALDGDDANDGTEASPWTLQAVADRAVPGSTVFVRAGTYHERVDVRVSGSAEEGPIVFRNYPGERPTLDGQGLEVPADFSGMISIESQHHVTVQGFEIRGYRTAESGHIPAGVWVSGRPTTFASSTPASTIWGRTSRGRSGGDAHGIAVYGTDSSHAIRDVVIDGNELFDLTLGSSEALMVNGNVQGFEITENEVHDTDNIGIDVIGFEGKAEDSSVDQARDGLVAGNLVYEIDSYGNPAYGRDRSADGIYIDGGRDVVVERSVIHHVNIGIELASEHGGQSTSHITVRNNVVHDASVISLAIRRVRPPPRLHRGLRDRAQHVRRQQGRGLLIQFDTRDNVIQNNIVLAGPGAGFLENPYRENEGNVLDHNVYYSSTGTEAGTWQWKEQHLSVLRLVPGCHGERRSVDVRGPGVRRTRCEATSGSSAPHPRSTPARTCPRPARSIWARSPAGRRTPRHRSPRSCRRRPRLRRPCYRSQ